MEAKTIATSLTCHRSSFVSKTRFSRLHLNRTRIGGGAVFANAVDNGHRGLALTRSNPIVSTRRLILARTIESDLPQPIHQRIKKHREWDSWTAKFYGGANIPFLMLQLPQIILNAQNLMVGNNTSLYAVPWMLLSYFVKKREKEAAVVQTMGVISAYVVLAQLTMAEAILICITMPTKYFVATSVVVAIGLVLNCLFYFGKLSVALWRIWEDFIAIGGLSVLPQARTGKLSEEGARFVGSLSGWTTTLMFMWMPVSQMWTNFLNPENIKGLSPITMVLAMMGNGLMIPRALFIRDLMWFTGSIWATLFYGYGNILCLLNCTSKSFFAAATVGLISWIGLTLWRDAVAYGHLSPFRSLKELVFGP
ncbi:unnamed protein product [Cochlearia groenlandica]